MTAGGADDTMASEDQSSLGGNTTYTFDVPDMSVRPLQPPASRYSAAPSISATSTMGPRSSRDGGRFDHTGGECDDFGVLNNEHFDSVARDMQTELYEARILTCEKEIEALHRNLQKERTLVASLKTQLQSTQEHVQQQVAHCGGKAPRSTNTTTTAVGAGASATQRGQQKSSEEQPAATQAAADTSSIQHQQGGEPHMSKARIASRRGSTGSIHVERTSSGIPTFAPAASATSSASTGAGAAVAGGAAPDTINDFSQDYVVLENPSNVSSFYLC